MEQELTYTEENRRTRYGRMGRQKEKYITYMHRLGQPDNHGERTQRQTQENDWAAEKEIIRYYKKDNRGYNKS